MKSKNTKFNNNLKIYLLLFLSVGISLSAQLPPGYGPKPSTTAISFNGDFSNIGGQGQGVGTSHDALINSCPVCNAGTVAPVIN